MRYANPPPEGTLIELSKCCHTAVWKDEDLITTCAACDQVCEIEKVRLKLSEALNAKEWPTDEEIRQEALAGSKENRPDCLEQEAYRVGFYAANFWLRERMKDHGTD